MTGKFQAFIKFKISACVFTRGDHIFENYVFYSCAYMHIKDKHFCTYAFIVLPNFHRDLILIVHVFLKAIEEFKNSIYC